MRYYEICEGQLPPYVRRRYLAGSCYEFALALKERFPNAQFVALGNTRFTTHVGLRIGDIFLDVRGSMTESQFREGYPDLPLITIDQDDVATQCGLANVPPPYKGIPEIAAARRAVKEIFPKDKHTTHK